MGRKERDEQMGKKGGIMATTRVEVRIEDAEKDGDDGNGRTRWGS